MSSLQEERPRGVVAEGAPLLVPGSPVQAKAEPEQLLSRSPHVERNGVAAEAEEDGALAEPAGLLCQQHRAPDLGTNPTVLCFPSPDEHTEDPPVAKEAGECTVLLRREHSSEKSSQARIHKRAFRLVSDSDDGGASSNALSSQPPGGSVAGSPWATRCPSLLVLPLAVPWVQALTVASVRHWPLYSTLDIV